MSQRDTIISVARPPLTQRTRASRVATALTITLAFAFGGAALAAERGRGSGRESSRGEGRALELFRRLDLTKPQEQRLEKARATLHEAREAVRKERRAVREVMREELAKNAPDAERLRAALARRRVKVEEAGKVAIDELLAVHALLTPEQRARLFKGRERQDLAD